MPLYSKELKDINIYISGVTEVTVHRIMLYVLIKLCNLIKV